METIITFRTAMLAFISCILLFACETLKGQSCSLVVNLPSTSICYGTSVNLSASYSPSGPNVVYLWMPGGQTTSSITVSPTASTLYTVVGCDTVALCCDTVTIPVSVCPLPIVTITGADTISCGQSVTLCAAGGMASYSWSTGATSSCIMVSPSTTTTYSVVAVDPVCACINTDSFTVVVTAPCSPSVSISPQTINTCAGNCVTLTAVASGGTIPYSYVWSTGATTPSIMVCPTVSTAYTVTVQDATAATSQSSSTVFVFPCNSACGNRDFENGDFTNWAAQSGNNTGSSSLTWSGGLVSNGNDASVFDVSARHTILTVNQLDTFCYDPSTNQPDVFMTTLAPNGGSFSVRLGNANMGCEAEGLKIPFTVTSSDTIFTFQYACVFEDPGHFILDQPGFMVNVYDSNNTIITNLSDTIYSADPLYPFISSASPWNSMIKYRRWSGYSINLAQYVGQTVTIEFNNFDCGLCGHFGYTYLDGSCFGSYIANVWPGDCDYDLYANNVDLLTLGIAYGTTGPTRANASNNWVAQPSADWPQSIQLGANYKHSDCNGDGVVNANDTLAIHLNYGNSHPFRIQGSNGYNPIHNNALPTLHLVIGADTVGPNTLVNADIMLGSSAKPVDSIYGIAFTITYDPVYINAFNIGANFWTSWLGTIGTDMISLQKNKFSAGMFDLAVTRINQTNALNGSGKLGTFTFKTTPVTSVSSGNIPFTIVGVKAITVTGRIVSLNVMGDNVYFDPNLLGVVNYLNPDLVSVFPNPASDKIFVTLPFEMENVRIELLNTIGQAVAKFYTSRQSTQVDVSSLPDGVYQMRITCEKGSVMKKIQIIKPN